jgi:predicted DNA-binding transcriptional regulator AlpA
MSNLLRPEIVAARAGISTRTLFRRMKDCNGPRATQVGKFVMFTEAEVDAWLARCRAA